MDGWMGGIHAAPEVYVLVTHLKGEGVSVVPSLLQQGFVHGAQSRLVALGVDLNVGDPDVLPEAQTYHVQVVAAVTEGTHQVHKH